MITDSYRKADIAVFQEDIAVFEEIEISAALTIGNVEVKEYFAVGGIACLGKNLFNVAFGFIRAQHHCVDFKEVESAFVMIFDHHIGERLPVDIVEIA